MIDNYTLTRRHLLRILGIATSIAVAGPVLSACSGNAGGTGSVRLEIGSDGNKDTLSANAGQDVTLIFNNTSDSLQHNWVLADGGDDVAAQIAQDGQAAGAENDYIPQDTNTVIAHPVSSMEAIQRRLRSRRRMNRVSTSTCARFPVIFKPA